MKLEVEAKALTGILEKAGKALPSRPIISLTKKIKLIAREDLLTAIGTDNALFISAWCEAEVSTPGEVLVQPALLEIARATRGKITLALRRALLCVIRAEGETFLSTEAAEDFPIPKQETEQGRFTLSKKQLAGLATILESQDALVSHRSVYVVQDAGSNEVVCAALPKHAGRATITTITAETGAGMSAILPGRYLGLAARATNAFTVSLGNARAIITGVDCQATFPLEAGVVKPMKYFDGLIKWEAVHQWFPDSFDQFIAELKLSEMLSMDAAPCTLEYDGMHLLLESGGNDLGYHNAQLGIEAKTTEPWRFRVNATFYIDALKHIGKGGIIELLPVKAGEGNYLNTRISDGKTWHIISPLADIPKKEVT